MFTSGTVFTEVLGLTSLQQEVRVTKCEKSSLHPSVHFQFLPPVDQGHGGLLEPTPATALWTSGQFITVLHRHKTTTRDSENTYGQLRVSNSPRELVFGLGE